MIDKLLKIKDNAYAPISNVKVSAVVIMKDKKEFYGVNVEDASTRAGTCAERNAIFNAITNGYNKGDFEELHLLVSNGKISTPCFVCRQLIIEMFDLDKKIYCYNSNGDVKVFTVKELCPYPFTSEDLV